MALKYCQYSSVTLSYLGFLFLVCNSRVDGSTLKLLSVTRSANSGDSFELHSHNDSVCDISSCGQYGGLLRREESGKRTTGKCSCYCNSAVKPTFYSTKLGQQGCVKDVEVLKDSNGGKQYIFIASNLRTSRIIFKSNVSKQPHHTSTRQHIDSAIYFVATKASLALGFRGKQKTLTAFCDVLFFGERSHNTKILHYLLLPQMSCPGNE